MWPLEVLIYVALFIGPFVTAFFAKKVGLSWEQNLTIGILLTPVFSALQVLLAMLLPKKAA